MAQTRGDRVSLVGSAATSAASAEPGAGTAEAQADPGSADDAQATAAEGDADAAATQAGSGDAGTADAGQEGETPAEAAEVAADPTNETRSPRV